jgi:hypothetical protein
MQNVDGAVVVEERLQSGPAQQPEAPAIVGVVAVRVAVVALTIEGRRVVDETNAIPPRLELDQRDLGHALGSKRVRDGERSDLRVFWDDHAPVLGQEDVHGPFHMGGDAAGRLPHHGPGADPDLRLHDLLSGRLGLADRGNGPRQGIHDVTQAARLGPGLALGGDTDDTHAVAPVSTKWFAPSW